MNTNKDSTHIKITFRQSSGQFHCMDLIKGITVSNAPTLKPNEVYFVAGTNSPRRGAI